MNFFSSFFLLALLVLLVLLYRRDFSKNKFLAVFRFLAIIFFVLIVGGAVWSFAFRSPPKPGIIYLVDRSQSMSLENKPSQLSSLLNRPLVLDVVSAAYWGFSDSARPQKNLTDGEPAGNRTDIAAALEEAKRKNPGSVLVISDGWHNGTTDPVSVTSGLGFPVYTIGLGREPQRDLLVSRIIAPKRAYLNDTVRVAVRLQSFGFPRTEATVRLLDGQKIIALEKIPLAVSSSEQEVEFTIVPRSAGHALYSVVAEEKSDEDNYQNNRRDFGLEVLKRKLTVVYLSNQPTPNSQFLKSILKGEEIKFQSVVAFAGNRFQTIEADTAFEFPTGQKLDCDCLILDNLDVTRLDEKIKKIIREYALTGGVLVLGGDEFRPAEFSTLLPLTPKGTIWRKEIFLTPAPDGLASPLFYDGEINLVADIPPFYACNESQGLGTDARVLASDAKSKIPLIGYSRSGKGRILEFSFFPLWRWGLSLVGIGKTVDPCKKFLLNCLYFLSLRDEELFRLFLDKPSYYAGEDITFTLEARSLTGAPLSGLDASVAISPLGQSLPMVERQDGVYEATVPGLPPGSYTVTGRGLKDGKPVGAATALCTVVDQSLELLDTGRNADLLKKIAETSGGEYYGAESLPPAGIAVALAPRTKTFRFEPQNNPLVYLIFTALLCLELFMRKRKGLP